MSLHRSSDATGFSHKLSAPSYVETDLYPELFTVVQQGLTPLDLDDGNIDDDHLETPSNTSSEHISKDIEMQIQEHSVAMNHEADHYLGASSMDGQLEDTTTDGHIHPDSNADNADDEDLGSCFDRTDRKFGHLINLETSVADTEDFPRKW